MMTHSPLERAIQAAEKAIANPLLDEQRDFLESIRAGRPARVTGEQARELSVTERVPISEVEQVEIELDEKETTANWTRVRSTPRGGGSNTRAC